MTPELKKLPVDWYEGMVHPCSKGERAAYWAKKEGYHVLSALFYDISDDTMTCLVAKADSIDVYYRLEAPKVWFCEGKDSGDKICVYYRRKLHIIHRKGEIANEGLRIVKECFDTGLFKEFLV